MNEQERVANIEKLHGTRKKARKPLGIVYILGGLLFAWVVSGIIGGTDSRGEWVWKDFKTIQGHYLGVYWHRDVQFITVRTTDGMVQSIALDPNITFSRPIMVGSAVEVHYMNSDPAHPRLVRGSDIKNVYAPTTNPENPGGSTKYWW
jgi:hypothetical protein